MAAAGEEAGGELESWGNDTLPASSHLDDSLHVKAELASALDKVCRSFLWRVHLILWALHCGGIQARLSRAGFGEWFASASQPANNLRRFPPRASESTASTSACLASPVKIYICHGCVFPPLGARLATCRSSRRSEAGTLRFERNRRILFRVSKASETFIGDCTEGKIDSRSLSSNKVFLLRRSDVARITF